MVSVREASVEDAAELLEIYRPYVEHTDVSFEYVTPSVQEFAGRIARTHCNGILIWWHRMKTVSCWDTPMLLHSSPERHMTGQWNCQYM